MYWYVHVVDIQWPIAYYYLHHYSPQNYLYELPVVYYVGAMQKYVLHLQGCALRNFWNYFHPCYSYSLWEVVLFVLMEEKVVVEV